MESVAAAILERVATSVPKLRELQESETALKPSPDRWSKKEILGHLIDLACNTTSDSCGEELSLAAVIEDYVRHLDHHLAQLNRPANPAA